MDFPGRIATPTGALTLPAFGEIEPTRLVRARKILCERPPSFAGLHPVPASGVKGPQGNNTLVIADLIKRQTARPRTLKTLSSTIHALFQKKLSDDELRTLLDELSRRGVITVSEGKISYDLSKGLLKGL